LSLFPNLQSTFHTYFKIDYLIGKPTYASLKLHFKGVVDWKTLAAFLLDDPNGTTCARIDKTHKGDVNECVDALIKEYMSYEEVSWEHVLDSLRKSSHRNLAKSIQEQLNIQ